MQQVLIERRSGTERRHRSVGSYLRGALNPRRRAGRRESDTIYPIIDWHSPRVLAWVITILMLCVLDGVLTVILLANGAVELNPFMAQFVPHSLPWFAAVKLSLTAIGMMVLVVCSQMKVFGGAFRGEMLLAMICAGYVALIVHQLRMLDSIH